MIEAKHSKVFEFIFHQYISFASRRHFRKIEIIGEIKDKGIPMLVIANHISWWDGFWVLRLNRKTLKRQFHVMMLEEQLRKNMFLRKLGAFSINRSSRSMIRSLAYGAELLHDPGNLLLLFPQGAIGSQYTGGQVFQKGWGRILKMVNKPLQVVFVVHLLDYLTHQKPTLSQYIFSPEDTVGFSSESLGVLYNNFYQQCLDKQKILQ